LGRRAEMIGSSVVSSRLRQVWPARGGDVRHLVEDIAFRRHSRACLEHMAPKLGLAFIDPQQAVAHRGAEVGSEQIGTATKLSVPAVDEFVRQQIVVGKAVLPIGEIARLVLIFRAAVMLEPDAAHPVGDCVEEIIMVVMARAERPHRLSDEIAMLLEYVGGDE